MDAAEQSAFDKMKSDLATATSERDAGVTEVAKVKRDGEKMIDDATGLQRLVDDQKKQLTDLAKGIASGAAGGGGKPAASGAAASDQDASGWWQRLKDDLDSIYYWPQKPPGKSD